MMTIAGVMGRPVCEDCSWCGEKSLKRKDQTENQIKVLLSLLGLSSSVSTEKQIFLCSDCNDLVYVGEGHRQRLDEVKTTLKSRAVQKIAECGRTRKSSNIAVDTAALRLGQRIAKCFSNCVVELESIPLGDITTGQPLDIRKIDQNVLPTLAGAYASDCGAETDLDGLVNLVQKVEVEVANHGEDGQEAAESQVDIAEGDDVSDGVPSVEGGHNIDEIDLEDEPVKSNGDQLLVSPKDSVPKSNERKRKRDSEEAAIGSIKCLKQEIFQDPEPENLATDSDAEGTECGDNRSDGDFSVQECSSSEDSSDVADDDDFSFEVSKNSLSHQDVQRQTRSNPLNRITRSVARNKDVILECGDDSPKVKLGSPPKVKIGSPPKVKPGSPPKRRHIPGRHVHATSRTHCLLCPDPVIESASHLLEVHNLQQEFGSCYYCSLCLQAYLPSDPTSRTGLVTPKDLEDFKRFATVHKQCIEQLEEAKAPQVCRFCQQHFTTALGCIAHEQEVHEQMHNGRKCFKCSDCFDTTAKYKAHKNIHLMDEHSAEIRKRPNLVETQCPVCDFTALVSPTMSAHMEAVHNLSRKAFRDETTFYNCSNCLIPFQSQSSLQPVGHLEPDDLDLFKQFALDHAQCNRSKCTSFKCLVCSQEFQDPTQLLNHQYENHWNKFPRKCRICSDVLYGNRAVEGHWFRIHSQPFLAEHKCYGCWKSFGSVDELQSHFAEIGHVPPHRCKYYAGFLCMSCGLSFDTPNLLAIHMQEFHDCREEMTFHCQRCRQNFNSNAFNADSQTGTFKTFTALCAQHFQGCLVENSNVCTEAMDSKFECYICTQSVDCPQDFAVHLNHHVGVKMAFKCPICTHISPSESSHRTHVSRCHRIKVHWSNIYRCRVCYEPWRSQIRTSIQGQFDGEEEDQLAFLEFVQTHQDCKRPKLKTFRCKFCDCEIRLLKFLRIHEVQNHTKCWPYRCDQCNEGFTTFGKLVAHIELLGIHTPAERRRRVTCRKARSTVANREQLADSSAVPPLAPKSYVGTYRRQKAEPYTCPKCGKVFKTMSGVNSHKQRHVAEEAKEAAGPEGRFPHVCDECGKDFALAPHLATHKRYHGKQKQTQESQKQVCHVCGKNFSNVNYLRYHIWGVHPGEPGGRNSKYAPEERRKVINERNHRYKANGKKHLCTYCGKAFYLTHELEKHVNIHTGNKPYVCKTCGRGFASPSGLRAHEKLHNESRERTVPCPHCDKKFFTKANADQHVRVYHNKLPWPGKIKSYTQWIPKNPEALKAAGIEYKKKSDAEDSD